MGALAKNVCFSCFSVAAAVAVAVAVAIAVAVVVVVAAPTVVKVCRTCLIHMQNAATEPAPSRDD